MIATWVFIFLSKIVQFHHFHVLTTTEMWHVSVDIATSYVQVLAEISAFELWVITHDCECITTIGEALLLEVEQLNMHAGETLPYYSSLGPQIN